MGSPTFTGHLAPALVALADGRFLGVVHVTANEQCSWFEFAQAIVDGADLSCHVQAITTAEFPLPAPRPAYSVMRSSRGAPQLPSWREGLVEYQRAVEATSA